MSARSPHLPLRPLALALPLALGSLASLALSPIGVAAEQIRELSYDIPAGPLANQLNQFAAQAGIYLAGDGGLTAGKTAPALRGSYSVEQALMVLLKGSGLRAVQTAPGAYELQSVVAADSVLTLNSMTVSGNASATASATDGYVAKRSTTATKTDTPLIETPQSISVVTRKQMDEQNVQNVGDALRYTAGVNAEANGVDTRRDTIAIRGFDATTSGGIYRDGLRQYSFSNQSRQVGETYGLEQVEVLRGPSSILYGQGAPAGIVNLVSKRPTETPLHEIKALYGSNDRAQLGADFGGTLDDQGEWLYRLTGLLRDSDTQVDYAKDDRQFIAPALTWKPSEQTSLTLLSYFQKDRNVMGYYALPRVGTLTGSTHGHLPTDLYVGDPDFDKYDVEQWSIGYQFEQQLDDIWTFRQNTRYSRSYQDQRDIYQWGLDDDERTLSRYAFIGHETVKNAMLDNQLQANWSHGAFEHTSLLGIDYQRARTDQLAGADFSTPPLDAYDPVYHQSFPFNPEYDTDQTQTLKQAGLYLQDQLKFDDHWVFNLGGRKDWTRKETADHLSGSNATQRDHAFTWRTGLLYLADNGLAPYASYSESFLPVISSRSRTGSAFEPETGQQYEVGVKYQPRQSNSFVTVSLFDLTRQNVTTADPQDNRFSLQTGEQRSRGVELEAKASLSASLDLIGNYSYSDVEITKSNDGDKGNRPNSTPRTLASLWAQYAVHNGSLAGLGFGAGVRYVGNSYGDNENTISIPSYTLFDATVSYELAKLAPSLRGVQIALNASNLTDETYVSQCGYTGDSCKYGYRRTLAGSVTYNW
ncbi:TonB-dependent siderophore receptor [Pseudomonas sp.]|uniref:TonB-dependent siderophore receptor n=1 Tax=Pseudomonas sp. TaxID=306 RepID=UPI0028B0FA7C|nr:TonB-dependent siderophore receptor [Pseudomonas sp.]